MVPNTLCVEWWAILGDEWWVMNDEWRKLSEEWWVIKKKKNPNKTLGIREKWENEKLSIYN